MFSFALSALPLMAFSARAVQFDSLSNIDFDQSSNEKPFYELGITADKDGEITKEHGITLMIAERSALQWAEDKNNNITVGGPAANKIVTPVVPVISENLYNLHIAVKEDFKKGDRITLNGVTPISFKETENGLLGIDLDGDGFRDADNLYQFRVEAEARSDFHPPNPPADVKVVYEKDFRRIKLTWKNPKNYDYTRTVIAKKFDSADVEVYSGTGDEAYDLNAIEGQQVTYEFFSNDERGNISKKVMVELKIGQEEAPAPEEKEEQVDPKEEQPQEETPEETPEEEREKPSDQNNEELQELRRLLNYYRIRYEIKCLRPGVSAKDSNCLWSKINWVYARQKLNEANTVSLTSEDRRLMKLRIRWPENRYQTYCVEADEPAKYCDALKKSIDRVHYFIDQP